MEFFVDFFQRNNTICKDFVQWAIALKQGFSQVVGVGGKPFVGVLGIPKNFFISVLAPPFLSFRAAAGGAKRKITKEYEFY